MKTDMEWALKYAPIIHFDIHETIPLRAVGVTLFRETQKSPSFPKRIIIVPVDAAFVIEYAYYFDYDIEHMYDLEHIWVTVGKDEQVKAAEASFHGKYLNLLIPELRDALPPTDSRVHAFCQPGKHAFLPVGDLFRLVPRWKESCLDAGGPVLIGNPFSAEYSPTGKDLFVPSAADDQHSIRYLKENLSFQPTLQFEEKTIPSDVYMSWAELYQCIPRWIYRECQRLNELYGGEESHV